MLTDSRLAGLVAAVWCTFHSGLSPAQPPGEGSAALRIGVPAIGAPLAWMGADNAPRGLLVDLWRLAESQLGEVSITLCGSPADCRADLEAQVLDLAGPMDVGDGGGLIYSQPVFSLVMAAATRDPTERDARALRRAQVGLIDPSRAAGPAPSRAGAACDSRTCNAVRRWRPSQITLLQSGASDGLQRDDIDVLVGPRALLLQAFAGDGDAVRLFYLWRYWQYLASRANDAQRLQVAEQALRSVAVEDVASLDGFTSAFPEVAQFAHVRDVPPLSAADKLFLDRHPAVHLGASGGAPLTVFDGGAVAGIVLDSLRYHLERIGVTPVFEVGPWEDIVGLAEAGRLDGIGYVLSPGPFADRFDLTEPLVRASFVAAVAPGAPFVGEVDDLDGLRAVLQADYERLQPTIMERFPAARVERVAEPADALLALLDGRTDVWFEFLPVVRNTVLSDGSVRAQAIRPLNTGLFDGMALALNRSLGLAPLVALVNDSINSAGAALDTAQARRPDQAPAGAGAHWDWIVWLVITVLLAFGCWQLLRQLLRERARLRRNDRALRRAQLLSRVGSLEVPPPYGKVVMNGDTPRLLDLPANTAEQSLADHLALFEERDAALLDAALETTWRTGRANAMTVTSRADPPRRYLYELSPPQPTETHGASVLVTLRDVTEQHEQERRQRELEREIVELQQLDALGRLAAGIAHDFNNVLVVIISSAELALRDTDPEHPAHGSLQQILQAGLRSRELVAQLLNSVRPPAQERARLDLRTVVEDTLALLRPRIPDNVALEVTLPDTPVAVTGNPVQLNQVFSNLVSNALDAMPSGGTLAVRLECPARPEGHQALLSVRDTGVGMDEATREQIFEYFFTTRSSGNGLGLAIVRNIVLAHGGAIDVVTAPGEGAEFRISLPLAPAGDGDHDEQRAPPQPHLLVVDDEREILAAVSSGLRARGYRVRACPSASNALEVVNDLGDDFDAVLCDLTLPGTSGVALASEIKRRQPDLPVVLLADMEEREALRAEAAVDQVVDKRIGSEDLHVALDKLLSQQRRRERRGRAER
jgi:signal transduction histidine kinase/CheY-like chemotaxis protein